MRRAAAAHVLQVARCDAGTEAAYSGRLAPISILADCPTRYRYAASHFRTAMGDLPRGASPGD